MKMTAVERLMRYVSPEPMSGCWLWTGGLHGNGKSSGYGSFGLGGKPVKAHRASFMLLKGPIPKGMSVCHKCDVRSCVNPDHLFLGTQRDNVLDMHKKGRDSRSLSSTCQRGHSKELFMRLRLPGYMYCIECQNAKRRARRNAEKEST